MSGSLGNAAVMPDFAGIHDFIGAAALDAQVVAARLRRA